MTTIASQMFVKQLVQANKKVFFIGASPQKRASYVESISNVKTSFFANM